MVQPPQDDPGGSQANAILGDVEKNRKKRKKEDNKNMINEKLLRCITF